jgi:cytochrome c-type biogenesis protein CcmH/NrfF
MAWRANYVPMRSLLLGLMLAPHGLVIVVVLLLRHQLRRFQKSTPQIKTHEDVAALKQLATVHVYAGLLSHLLWLPWLVWVYGFFIAGVLTWADLLLFVAIPFALVIAAALAEGGPAREVQSTRATSPALQEECDDVVEFWRHGKLPES